MAYEVNLSAFPTIAAFAQHLHEQDSVQLADAIRCLHSMMEADLGDKPNSETFQSDTPSNSDSLASLETYLKHKYTSILAPSQVLGSSKVADTTFIHWNIRGMRANAPALAHLVHQHRPLAVAVTETHTHGHQHGADWLKGIAPGYQLFMSSLPSGNALARLPASARQTVKVDANNPAGVLLAVDTTRFQHQYLRQHTPPAQLKGYCVHVSLHLPASPSLHMIAVYCPPSSNPVARQIQQQILQYAGSLLPQLQKQGCKVLLSGDMNAVMHASHRSNGTLNPMDRAFQAGLQEHGLDTCFTAEPSLLPHTCRSDRVGRAPATSRIDHFLTMAGRLHGQPECQVAGFDHVLHDAMYECSDHSPLLCRLASHAIFGYAPMCPADEAVVSPKRVPQQTSLCSFPKAGLMAWRAAFQTQHLAEIHQCTRQAQDLLSAENVQLSALEVLADRVNALIHSARSIADDHLPTTATIKEWISTHAYSKQCRYLPRKLARQHKLLLGLAKASRLAYQSALQCQNQGLSYELFSKTSAFAAYMLHYPDESERILAMNSYSAYMDMQYQTRKDAQLHIRQILAQHRRNGQQAKHRRWQRMWFSRRKRAYSQVFQQHDERGAAPSELPAVLHPLHGVSAAPEVAMQGLAFFHAQAASPKVSQRDISFPWETTHSDCFRLQARGDRSPLAGSLTFDLYMQCLRSLKNGRVPGVDRLPNELLKHFPAEMHQLLYSFLCLCWHEGYTPSAWKYSCTKLFFKKGDPCNPRNYRPIALLSTVYKLWTKIAAKLVYSYAESNGILSEAQEGFRKFKNCKRQLQYMKLAFEDARLHRQDLYMCLLDLKKAFDSVDHARLFAIMRALGFPEDAVRVVESLHVDAFTTLQTNFGTSHLIPIRRGTIQGDSMSPLLFIIFIEPLLRWLQMNDRGYRCRSVLSGTPHYANCLAAADDLALLSGSPQQLQVQLHKVEAFTSWSGMSIAPAKSILSAILWGAHARGMISTPSDWDAIRPILAHVRCNGEQMRCLPPDEPFRYLGPLLTLTLGHKPHLKLLLDMIHEKGVAIAKSPATLQQKVEMERQCVMNAVAYHLYIAPFSRAQLAQLELARARVHKAIFRIPNSSPSDMMHMPQAAFGCGVEALQPLYAQICCEAAVSALNDAGRLGHLARAVAQAHLKKARASLEQAQPGWATHNTHMVMRQAFMIQDSGMSLRHDAAGTPMQYMLGLGDLVNCMVRSKAITVSDQQLQDHVLAPLWRVGIYDTSSVQTAVPSIYMTLDQLLLRFQELGKQLDLQAQRAYCLFLQICCMDRMDFQHLVGSFDLPHPPSTTQVLQKEALQPLTPLSARLASLPSLIELDCILSLAQTQQPGLGDCSLIVQWCPSTYCPQLHVQKLAALGIYEQQSDLMHPGMPNTMTWKQSIVQQSVLRHLWPAKLAAFEAQQLLRLQDSVPPHMHPPYLEKLLSISQTSSQGLAVFGATAPLRVTGTNYTIDMQEANPDRDIHATGSCVIAKDSHDRVVIYGPEGNFVSHLPFTVVQKLAASFQGPENAHEYVTNFTQAVHDVTIETLADCKQQDKTASVQASHCCAPSALIECLTDLFPVETEWFASALDRSSAIPYYASVDGMGLRFGSLGTAFRYKWTGSGYLHPPHSAAYLRRTVQWAIRSCYEDTAVFNLLLMPKQRVTSALASLLQHPCVHRLACFPKGSVPMSLAPCLDPPDALPASAMELWLVANHAGMQHYWPKTSSARATALRTALRRHGFAGVKSDCVREVHAPLPKPCILANYAHASCSLQARSTMHHITNVDSTALLDSIVPSVPPLRFCADEIVYTDASKRGTSLTAAWVLPSRGYAQACRLPGPSAPERTVVRGELAAIHSALHSPLLPRNIPMHLMTDSLTSLQLIGGYIARPFEFRDHKHLWLVSSIAQNILSRTSPIILMKVRAHIGIKGNTAADALANDAHDDQACIPFSFADPVQRGPAWVQHTFGDSLSDVDNLHRHPLQIAQVAAVQKLHNRADHVKSKAFARFAALAAQSGGVQGQASNAFWTAASITPYMVSLALRVRMNTLITRSKLAQWYPDQGLPTTCPLCNQAKDTAGHRLGACTFPAVKKQICARHGHAVNAISQEILQGSLARCAMMVDAECHDRYRALPASILPLDMQTSRPDIVLIQGYCGDMASLRAGQNRDPMLQLHLVEVTFTSDLRVHDRVATKMQQHAQLCADLRAFGWVNVHLHIFIMGHTGVVRVHNTDILHSLGVPVDRTLPFLRSLAVMALQRSTGILRCFPSCGVGAEGTSAGSQTPLEDNGNDEGGASPESGTRQEAVQPQSITPARRLASSLSRPSPAPKRPRFSKTAMHSLRGLSCPALHGRREAAPMTAHPPDIHVSDLTTRMVLVPATQPASVTSMHITHASAPMSVQSSAVTSARRHAPKRAATNDAVPVTPSAMPQTGVAAQGHLRRSVRQKKSTSTRALQAPGPVRSGRSVSLMVTKDGEGSGPRPGQSLHGTDTRLAWDPGGG